MLQELSVESLLLIDAARLRLAPGLNVITGETGAGKSVLAHALDLLLGGRARSGIVRPGTPEAYVEGVFDLPPWSHERVPAGAQELVLARRVGADGRTRAYINGRSATVSELGRLCSSLISFYGQHEHRRLTISAAQLELLDASCGPEQALRLRGCARSHAERVELSARLAALQERCRERDRELDLLEHELAEIESGAVDEHQHDQLLATRERMRRVDALCAAAGAAAEELVPESAEAQGAAALLASAGGRLQSLAGVDAQLDVLAERTRSLAIEAHELAGELRAYGDGVLAAGGEGHAALALDQLEQRLEATERLARKYGGSARSVCEYAQRARARSDELKLAGVEMGQAGEQLARVQGELEEHVCALRAARRSAAPRLAAAVREQLAALGMGDADFEVRLTEREPGPGGGDAVEFVISPNPGVPAGPVREIASGGELSRIMLALTAAGARAARQRRRGAGAGGPHTPPASGAAVPTLAFDELDAGIGGRAARAVGSRLRELARARQLLCITHLPQIASLGERHFSIVKDTAVSPAVARVMQLEEGDVVAELVRMLGADASDSAAARHARDLRRVA